MVNKNTLGIIFPNTYDDLIPELVHRRTMASVPFGGRYRMIDFTLSAMVNAGIDNVTVLAKKNYYSLMDHLGNGREWDLSASGRPEYGAAVCPKQHQNVPWPCGGHCLDSELFGGAEGKICHLVRLQHRLGR